jgi:hypothetical protein
VTPPITITIHLKKRGVGWFALASDHLGDLPSRWAVEREEAIGLATRTAAERLGVGLERIRVKVVEG